MDTCSICLDEIKDNHIVKKLSCNHTFHFLCFKKMVYHNNNVYINCPLCREMNYNIDKPFPNDHKRNISIMCHSGVGKVRCICNLKTGNRCKNKPVLMNYGKCYSHSKNILKKEYYKLYSNYLYYILGSNYNWLTIIYLLDVGKKIIIKFLNKDSQVSDVLQYYYRYLNDKKNGERSMFYMNGIYRYYDLEKIPKNWLDYCVNKNVII